MKYNISDVIVSVYSLTLVNAKASYNNHILIKISARPLQNPAVSFPSWHEPLLR